MANVPEHRIQMPAPGAGKAAAPEKGLNRFVHLVALLERAGNALGTLAFTWATVVLLGGYPTGLRPTDDFWFATTIVFLEAARMPIKARIEVEVLNTQGKNYATWAPAMEALLESKWLSHIIHGPTNECQSLAALKSKMATLSILTNCISEELKNEYLMEMEPKILWGTLRKRFHHHEVVAPKDVLMNKWNNLRFQDFESVAMYALGMDNLLSDFEELDYTLTENEMKTTSTMHVEDVSLAKKLQAKEYTSFSALIHCLLLIETELAMKPNAASVPRRVTRAERHRSRRRTRTKIPYNKQHLKNHYDASGKSGSKAHQIFWATEEEITMMKLAQEGQSPLMGDTNGSLADDERST